jgi:hypothetical protein
MRAAIEPFAAYGSAQTVQKLSASIRALHSAERQMIRRDGRTTTDGDSALQDNHDGRDLWSINPWLTSHMIGAAHSQRIDAAEQERGRAMFAALSERLAAATVETGQEEPSLRA